MLDSITLSEPVQQAIVPSDRADFDTLVSIVDTRYHVVKQEAYERGNMKLMWMP